MLQLWLALRGMDPEKGLASIAPVLAVLQLAQLGELLTVGVPLAFEGRTKAEEYTFGDPDTFWEGLEALAKKLGLDPSSKFKNKELGERTHAAALMTVRHIAGHSPDPAAGYHAQLYKLLLNYYGNSQRPQLLRLISHLQHVFLKY